MTVGIKRAILMLVSGLLSLPAICQVVAIQPDKMNVLYLCIANPLTIAVENTASSSIIVTTDNGEIRVDSFRKGGYTAWPAHSGVATIYVKKKTKKGIKVIGEEKFRVKKIPVSEPRFAGKKGGELSKAMVKVQIAPIAFIENFDFDARFRITDFTVIVMRRKKELYRKSIHDMNGARLDEETRSFFYKLRNGDRLLFTDIKVEDCEHVPRETTDMEFTIKDAYPPYHIKRRPKHGEQEVIDPITGETKIMKW